MTWRLAASLAFFAGCIQGQNPCSSCHPSEVNSYSRSAMALSLSEQATQPDGTVRHALSGSTVTIRGGGFRMTHRLQEKGLSAEYPVTYAVGAGRVGFSFLVSLPPICFNRRFHITRKRAFGM